MPQIQQPIDTSLDKRIKHYMAEHDVKKKDIVINAIKLYLDTMEARHKETEAYESV